MDNTTGDVLAMVGGRDYAMSQFNRATQAERQTGSSFKPYVYTAAVEDGAKPDDIIVDAPVSFGGYTPHNYENDYKGAMTLVNAFAESRNIPALKLAARVGIRKVIDVAHRFGVTSNIPAYLPVALGAVEITLEEQVASYSVFPNDGLRVQAAADPQGVKRRRHHAVGRTARGGRGHRPADGADHDDPAARGNAARHRRRGGAVESSARRQDGHHQRLHRRLVSGLFAVDHLRRVGGLRQQPVAGREGNRRASRAAHLDDLDAAAIAGKDDEQFPGRREGLRC